MAIIENILNPTVTEILSKKESWVSIADGIIRQGCYCHNFHLDHQYIIKQFRFPDDAPPPVFWWEREHKTLHILDGKLSSPITHGYIEFKYQGFTNVYLFREMVSGNTLGDLDYTILNREQCAPVGELLAKIHNHHLVTGDCHLSNILINEEGELCFIDFGKAEHFPKTNLAYGIRAARDLQKTKYKCTNLDPELSQLLEEAYLSKLVKKQHGILHQITRGLAKIHQALRLYQGRETIKTPEQLEARKKNKA